MFEELFAESQATLKNVDTYLTFPENHFGKAAMTRLFSNRPASIPATITSVVGPAGVGKSHLALSTVNELKQKHPRLKAGITTIRQLCASMQLADELQTLAELLESLATLDLLVAEDLDWLAQTPLMQHWFVMLLETIERSRTRLMITSRKPVGEMLTLDQRLVSRCHGGLTVGLSMPGLESRTLLLQLWFRELKLPIIKPFADSARFLAEQLPVSPRLLRETIWDLADHQIVEPCPIDVAYLQHWLKAENRSQRLSVDAIMKHVAQEFGLVPREIRSRSRQQNLAIPRQCAMLLARELTGQSLEQIGDYFGRSHATVSHSLSRLKELLPTVPILRQQIDRLRKQLRELPREDCA